jgi:ATP-binding cassette subfamily B protein
MLVYLPALVAVFVGLHDVQSGVLGLGALVSFLVCLGYLAGPVAGFAHFPMECQANVAASERLRAVLNATPTVIERRDARPLRAARGALEIAGLHFTYPGGRRVFAGIDLAIEPGETIALLGPSGVGKSTLAKLLLRFHDPDAGAIRIDGQDLRDVTLASLRAQVAIVWQEAFLLSATIRANLHLARPSADETELRAACEASQAWEFIERLTHGLDTRIGAGGVELSGGQRQRLAIAQALLRASPILILDEATSALDSHAERALVDALEQAHHRRTMLVIAHRHSTARRADRIVYLNGDGTISVGRHQQLLASHRDYAQAVEWQTQRAH